MNNNNENPGKKPLGRKLAAILPYILIPVLIIFGISFFADSKQTEKKQYYEIVQLFNEGEITAYSLNVSNGALTYYTKADGKTPHTYNVPSVSVFIDDVHKTVMEHNAEAEDKNDIIKADYISGATNQWLLSILPTAAMVVFLAILTVIMFRRMNNTMNMENNRAIGFGKAKVKMVKDEKRKTTFEDVAGADEEKEELQEIVEYLKAPEKFNKLGARIPKGVLLVGPPGTGKTLIARAVAGEADVPFFSISGSDFVEMYVGVGASRVRDLFEQAKKNSPSIIFIDEIDAVGRHRGAGMGGGHDEREQTLNQLLVEMDGFGANEGVIIIAATNRPDILDPALLRPGRFDRQVTVNYPDTKGRVAILKVHAENKPLGPDVELEKVAHSTVGFTGADLENLLNEAALLAARRGKMAITMAEIDEATIKVLVGTEKKSHKMTEHEKKLTSYHEAGHAVAGFYLENEDPVQQISIIPRGLAGGYTLHRPTEDKNYQSKKGMLDSLVTLLGGRVAEALTMGDISTGASNDIERATDVARKMVTKYGMSEKLGPIAFGQSNDEVFLGKDFGHTRNYSEKVAAEIDAEIERIINEAYDRTKTILSDHIDKLEAVATRLFDKEKIEGDEFLRIMNGEPEPEESDEIFSGDDVLTDSSEVTTSSDSIEE